MPFDPVSMGLAVGGGLFQGLGGFLGAGSQASAAKRMADQMKTSWQPVGTQTGYGEAKYDPATGQFTTGLTGQTADWQNQLFGQAMAPSSGQGAGFLTQGQGMMGQAAGMAPIDVAGMATDQYKLMSQMAQPGEQQQQGNMMAQLAARGMLGATGGAGQMGALTQAQGQADLGRQMEALGQARQAASLQEQLTGGMFGRGLNLAQFGQGMTQQELQNALQAGQTATGLFSLENQVGNTAQSLGQNQMAAMQASAPYQMQANQNPFASFLGGIGSSMSGMGNMGMLTGGSGGWAPQSPAGWGTVPGSQQSQMLASQW